MKKTLRNLFLSLILLVSALVLFPPPAHADSYRVTNYKELQEALKNASWYSWELEPNADFGWPSEPTTVNLKAGMYDYIGITGTWNIPSNVTIIQSSPMYNSGQINLSGTWKSSKYNPAPMVIKNRGKLIVEETDSYSFPITVENGGTIDLDRNWLVLTDKTTLTLKKGAKVNGTGKICMCDATIASDGATLTAELCASGYSSYGDSTKKPKNQIKGKLTVTNLNFNDDQHLYVTSGSTLTIGGRISNYDTKSSLTVENGGRLVTMDYVECPVNLIINDGGNFDIKGYFSLQKGHNIRIRKSGTITAYKSVTLENATRLTIDAGGRFRVYSANLQVSIRGNNKGYVKGSGTIYLMGYSPRLINDYKTVASTIKVNSKYIKKPVPLAKGKTFTVDGYKYKVTSAGKTVTLVGPTSTAITSAIVNGGASYQGVVYKVTSVYTKAFYKCSKLKRIFVPNDALTAVGSYALKGTPKNLLIEVPKEKLSAYKKLFANKGNTKIKFTAYN